MELWLTRLGHRLVPADEDTAASMGRIIDGTTILVRVPQVRSLAQLRYYWKLCTVVAGMQERFKTKEQVDQALRIFAGHADVFEMDGRTITLPRRIAFEQLEQAPWEEYLTHAKAALHEHVIPGIDLAALDEHIAGLM